MAIIVSPLWACGYNCITVVGLWLKLSHRCGLVAKIARPLGDLLLKLYHRCGLVAKIVPPLWACGSNCTTVVGLWLKLHHRCGLVAKIVPPLGDLRLKLYHFCSLVAKNP